MIFVTNSRYTNNILRTKYKHIHINIYIYIYIYKLYAYINATNNNKQLTNEHMTNYLSFKRTKSALSALLTGDKLFSNLFSVYPVQLVFMYMAHSNTVEAGLGHGAA